MFVGPVLFEIADVRNIEDLLADGQPPQVCEALHRIRRRKHLGTVVQRIEILVDHRAAVD